MCKISAIWREKSSPSLVNYTKNYLPHISIVIKVTASLENKMNFLVLLVQTHSICYFKMKVNFPFLT